VALAELVVDGESSATSLASAVKYATLACDDRDKNGCLVLGKYYWKREPDLGKARKLFQQACDLGSRGGCAGVKALATRP
jgi:TPR repeat protein